jgi:hypothetical protein
MTRRSNPGDVNEHLGELRRFLANFELELRQDDLRIKVQALIPVVRSLRDLGSSLISSNLASSARDRILFYFSKYPLRVIKGEEINVVAGISDWPRRVRELRKQFGWNIVNGITVGEMIEAGDIEPTLEGQALNDMDPDDYIMLSTTQDREAAHRWFVANTIRNKNESVKDKALEYLRENVGNRVTGEELRYVAKDKTEWARRVRELRTQEGWPILTRNTGAPDLPIGVYVLEDDRQQEQHDRKIPDDVRVAVLTRDGFKCTNPRCGWQRSMITKGDPRQFLELHHLQHHIDRGPNVEENLTTLCNVCHDGVHAGRLLIDWT